MKIVHFKKCGLSYNKTFARHFKYELLYIYKFTMYTQNGTHKTGNNFLTLLSQHDC